MTIVTGPKTAVSCAHCEAPLMRRPFRPKDGKRIANFFCGTACKGPWQRELKEFNEAWLRQKYLVEGLSTYAIAKIVGRDAKRVWEWIKDYGIETRPRGHDQRVWFKEGAPSAFTGRNHSPETREKLRQCRLEDGHVPYLKNGKHHLAGKTGADTPNWRGGVTPERQSFHSSDEWKAACAAVWHRADAKCERCGLDHRTIDRTSKAFHVHHVISFMVRVLRAEPTNLKLLCDTCHRWVHSRLNVSRELIGEVHV